METSNWNETENDVLKRLESDLYTELCKYVEFVANSHKCLVIKQKKLGRSYVYAYPDGVSVLEDSDVVELHPIFLYLKDSDFIAKMDKKPEFICVSDLNEPEFYLINFEHYER